VIGPSISMKGMIVAKVLMSSSVMTMASVWGNEASFTSWDEKVMGIWDHLVWVMGPSTVM
jgi:hypothetical protein